MDDGYRGLAERGFMRIGGMASTEAAFALAREAIDERCAVEGLGALEVIGDFVLPPHDGPETRDFQTLHFDFGLPLDPKVEQAIARYTALHIPADVKGVSAVTRLVPLVGLFGQGAWPSGTQLVRRLVTYGRAHGCADDSTGYLEGFLGPLVEAAAGTAPVLPSVKTHPDFLCGMEFDSLRAELAFFERHGLDVEAVQIEVPLQPGELLVFDNLALAHGRRGIRRPGELRQRVFGHKALAPDAQRELRDRVLCAFHTAEPDTIGSFA